MTGAVGFTLREGEVHFGEPPRGDQAVVDGAAATTANEPANWLLPQIVGVPCSGGIDLPRFSRELPSASREFLMVLLAWKV